MTRATLLLATLLPLTAAAQVDIQLAPFGTLGKTGTIVDRDGFKKLAGDLGQIMGPKAYGPGDTTGALGFDLGIAIGVTNIDEGREDWQKAVESAPGTLETLEIQVRKGLPYSFEVSGGVTHLIGSSLWGVGMHLKYAVVEGYRTLPDIALRTGVSTVLGSREMSLLVSTSDITVSKAFGAGGVLTITPFAGYSFMYVRASSYVLGVFPTDAPQPLKFVIEDPGFIHSSGGILGVRLASVHASLDFEMLIGEQSQTFTTRVGAEF